ncbi:VOC family protein [Paenibacillus wynnii]|uniref:VOC family protein n=1 Tax=Paenibacillus wynnii TaxID=268407 RepID=UPI0027923937|nr:VOC family protein [Paenibacillus wynnii]MDQ0193687.1 PhnB protein [Paenibacillus wynnii]
MLSASPYIVVDQVQESIEYYQSVFGGEIKILNEHNGKLLNAELHIGQTLIHFADPFGRTPKGENVRLIMQLDNEEETKKIYEQLIADGGQVIIELQNTFFGALHGQVADQMNGIIWVLNCFVSV